MLQLLLLLLLRGKEWGSWELGVLKRGARVWGGHELQDRGARAWGGHGHQDSDAIRGRRSRPLQHLLLHHGHHLHVLLHSQLDGVESRFLWVLDVVCAGFLGAGSVGAGYSGVERTRASGQLRDKRTQESAVAAYAAASR